MTLERLRDRAPEEDLRAKPTDLGAPTAQILQLDQNLSMTTQDGTGGFGAQSGPPSLPEDWE